MWCQHLESPSASPAAPQSVSGRGWAQKCSGTSICCPERSCLQEGKDLAPQNGFCPFLPHPAVSKRRWKNGVWEMQGDPAVMVSTGRSSPCALCSGKGAPGAHPGLVRNRGHGFLCLCSGQSPETASQVPKCNPVPSCPSLPPWLCHSAAASMVMMEAPLRAQITCLKQQTGEEELQHSGVLAHALRDVHLTRSSPKVVTPGLPGMGTAGNRNGGREAVAGRWSPLFCGRIIP